MSVLIAGSRDPKDPFAAKLKVSEMIQRLPLGMVVLNGGARGIDSYVLDEIRKHPYGVVHDLGVKWIAPERHLLDKAHIHCVVYRPRWRENGVYHPEAGLIRNLHMLDLRPEMVVVLWNGISPGSRHVYDEAGDRKLLRVMLEA